MWKWRLMRMKLYGEIQCTIDKNHPDIKHVKDWTKDKVFKGLSEVQE